MANKFLPNITIDKSLAKKVVEDEGALERLKADRGLLGSLWGASSSVPNNVAALVAIALVLFGMIYTLFALYLMPAGKEMGYIKDLWAIITPIITLAIGYLFGNKPNKAGE